MSNRRKIKTGLPQPQSLPVPICPDCGLQPGHAPGCPISLAIDAMMTRDRLWFLAHPDADHYYREVMPGDLGATTLDNVSVPPGGRVKVRQVEPGFRVRSLPPDLLVKFSDAEDGLLPGGIYAAQILLAGRANIPAMQRLLALRGITEDQR